ncbi:hypothetical protein MSP7336_03698 [Mycobacterium shimoidei]|uniref:Uncharacterized protein n=1 Tax=Mycobacterium shimoidei TaxID=29313 RepID=A0A375Z2S3_MYCSH|nr:hypothetical protein MSP7336_03698 [Mycobacterium shimoidei]
MYRAVRDLEDGIDRLPEAQVWEGQAHEAAAAMFGRATNQTSEFTTGVGAVGAALSNGDATIGAARYRLLRTADDIDEGELHVTDQWVVLIKPARMSAQHAAELQQQAEQQQAEINRLLLALGDADDGTAANVQAAAKKLGFTLPGPSDMGALFPQSPSRPADEVPNPRTMQGLIEQGKVRGEDMAMTVRESSKKTTEDDQHVTTLIMQDGSKHVIRTWGSLAPAAGDDYYDSSGKLVSSTFSQTNPLTGVKRTVIDWADGTNFTATENPDGTRNAAFTLPDGRHGVLPPNNPFFTGAAPTVLGGALTGLDAHVGRGGGIPGLTPTSVENVGKAARYAGPAVGIAATIYNVGAATSAREACVAGVSGVFGVAGDYAGGVVGAGIGGALPGVDVVTGPGGAIAGAYFGGKFLGSIGQKVGQAFCPG